MRSFFSRVSAMSAEQRGVLVEQFDKSSRVVGAEPGWRRVGWLGCGRR